MSGWAESGRARINRGHSTGISVLDLSQVICGPICGRMLADLGADVVKLEPPGGDIIRFLQPKVGVDPVSVYFTSVERGEALGLTRPAHPRGATLAQQLARGQRRRARELPARRRSSNTASTPRRCSWRSRSLVYCSINGWGGDNSWSQRHAYTAMVQAEVGHVKTTSAPARRAPEQSPHVDGDITPGLLTVTTMVAALFQRERTGEGQHLDVSMAEALVYTDEWTTTDLAGYDGSPHPRHVELPDLHRRRRHRHHVHGRPGPDACSRSQPRSPTTR